jgi:hypothetical protein
MILLLLFAPPNYSANQFVAPFGNDSNSGLTRQLPKRQLKNAIKFVAAGDTIFFLPGEYSGTQFCFDVHGAPEQEITVISYSGQADSFAIINGGATPGSDKNQAGLCLRRVSWLRFVNLKFSHCWTDVVTILQGNYLTFSGCQFAGGRRVIFPEGKECHHFLVENCYWNQDSLSWTTHDWEEMHHGALAHLNGALFHPAGTSGNYVVRGNVIKNAFNGFRTGATAWHEDGNGEIYHNDFINLADNAFEPEGWAFNLHFYHNRLHNIHKAFSIDAVKGGPLYLYGNVLTESRDANAIEKVSGIWKFKTGPLSAPCYVFNNSFFTEARAFKSDEATNQQLKHFNNAYFFFSGSNRFELTDWHDSFEFDFDCSNQAWPPNIENHHQEAHGMVADARFVSGATGDLRLQPDSPCRDTGKILTFPEFDWQQPFDGSAPDIGAFEGDARVTGPPFRFRQVSGEPSIREKPRIVRHLIEGPRIALFFSAELDPASVDPARIFYWTGNAKKSVQSAQAGATAFELLLETETEMKPQNLALEIQKWPVGVNGETATSWASTIPIKPAVTANRISVGKSTVSDDSFGLAIFPNPANAGVKIFLRNTPADFCENKGSLFLCNTLGQQVLEINLNAGHFSQGIRLDLTCFASEIYLVYLPTRNRVLTGKFLLVK